MDKFHEENCNSLQDLPEEAKNNLLAQPVKLQGRGFTPLGNLIDESMFTYIKSTDISSILSKVFNIGNELTSVPHYYIERSVSRIFIDPHVLQEVDTDFFLIDNCSENRIYKLPIRHCNVCDLEDLDFGHLDRCRIVLIRPTENLDKVKVLKDTGNPVHLLSVCDLQHLEWKWSYGSTKKLKPFQIQTDEFENCSVYTFSNTTRVLSAPPGMGKTTFMDHVAHRTDASVWVLKINLSEHQEYYKIVQDEHLTPTAIEYLTYFNEIVLDKSINLELSREVFRKLAKAKRVLVILDGFDEVPWCYRNEVMDMAKSFHNGGLGVWLTTSSCLASQLEEEFGTFSFNLKPFSVSDQKRFAIKYFSYLNLGIEETVDAILDVGNFSGPASKFAQIPLQTKLFFDAFRKKFELSFQNKLPVIFDENCDLLDLYKSVTDVASKFNDTFGADYRCSIVQKHLTLFALKLLFPLNNYIKSMIAKELEDYCENHPRKMRVLESTGIVKFNAASKLTFVHHTFAEFIAARWLSKNVNSKIDNKRETAQDLLRERFKHKSLFRFFDEIVTENCALHGAILNGEIEKVKGILRECPDGANKVDSAGRSLLHLAALYGVQFPKPLVHQTNLTPEEELFLKLKTFDNDPMLEIIDISEGFGLDMLGYSPLDYALLNRSFTIANKICRGLKIAEINARIDLNLKNKYLTYCVILGYQALFAVLLRYFASKDVLVKNVEANVTLDAYLETFYPLDDTLSRSVVGRHREMTILQFLQTGRANLNLSVCFGTKKDVDEILHQGVAINKQDIEQNTALHYAASHDKLENARAVLNKGADVNKRNLDGNTPLHLASKLGYFNIAKLLVLNHSNANIVNSEGFVPLHYAAKGGHITITNLLCELSDINKQNFKGETPLHLALKGGHTDIAKILLLNSANIQMADKKGETPLHTAASYDNTDMVAELIAQGADVNKQNNTGNTPIHLAAYDDCTDSAVLLLLNGADVNIENEEGLIPLHSAAKGGCTNIISELLSKTIDVNKQFDNGDTVLHWFSIFGETDLVKLLLSNGANVRVKNNRGCTPLHSAAIAGYCDIVSLFLLENLTHLDDQDDDGDTALHVASMKGHKHITKLLIDTGADINLENKKGRVAFHYAARGGYSDIVTQLMPKTFNISKQDHKGETALHLAVKYRCKHTAKLLLLNDASVDVENEKGRSVLHWAALIGESEIISELLDKGVTINKRDKNGETPLHLASREGYRDTVELLIDKGADVNIRNKKGRTALHNACIGGYIDVVNVILPKITKIDQRDNNGETPLHWVSILGDHDIAKALISKGADVNIGNKEGGVPLHYAAKRGCNILVTELLAGGANVDKQDNDGNTAIHLVSLEGHLDVAQLLVLSSADVNILNKEGRTAIRYATEGCYEDLAELLSGVNLNK